MKKKPKPKKTPCAYAPLVQLDAATNGRTVVCKDTDGSLLMIQEGEDRVRLRAYRLSELVRVAEWYEEDARARGENFGAGTGLYGKVEELRRELAEAQRQIKSLLLSVDRLDAKQPRLGWARKTVCA